MHNTWRIEQGLPQNTINAVVQTPDGYLWLGTEEGIVRFDGVHFEVYDKNNVTFVPAPFSPAIKGSLPA